MNETERAAITADEASVEIRYSRGLAKRAEDFHTSLNSTVPNTFTANYKIDVPKNGELIGRVALNMPDEVLDDDKDFYIGTARYDGGDFQVFSWAAPVACTYYRKSDSHHDYCERVVGVRVFAHQGGRISDLQDELMDEGPELDVFPKRQLEVPRAPVPRVTNTAPVAPSTKGDVESSRSIAPSPPPPAERASQPRNTVSTTENKTGPWSKTVPGPALRAPDLLRRQLAAPKTVAMSAVLATLQSDQYDAITRHASESQILQGHPGTGKTIVAAHRAAYLLNSEAPKEARPKGDILILGPTAEYVEHISGALRKLIDDESRYSVKSIPDLLEELADLSLTTEPTESLSYTDVDLGLAALVDEALQRAKRNIGSGDRAEPADVYAELKYLLHDPPDDGLEPEWVAHLRALPPTLEVMKRERLRRHRGLLAYLGVRTTHTSNPGHVIVDEAQDISPIEWQVLGRLGNSGGWTILGDLNQRRTDHSFSSWERVAEVLAIEDENGKAPVLVLERGYRSTQQVIHFANQLLPRADRTLYSLQQDGEPPIVTNVPSGRVVADEAVAAASKLIDRVGGGTVAVITVDTRAITVLLASQGWSTTSASSSIWKNGERTLRVIPPGRARGLEFDGVVVVEPADFPENVGRQGVLYTALTRANRLLTVVHRKPLPKGLKASG